MGRLAGGQVRMEVGRWANGSVNSLVGGDGR